MAICVMQNRRQPISGPHLASCQVPRSDPSIYMLGPHVIADSRLPRTHRSWCENMKKRMCLWKENGLCGGMGRHTKT